MEAALKLIPDEHKWILGEMQKFGEQMKNGEHSITSANGKNYPPGFLAETAVYAKEKWEGIRENDVFLASFPKTGTNWCTTVLWKIVTANTPEVYEKALLIPIPFFGVEMGPACKFQVTETLPIPRRVFITHLDGEDFPVEKATRRGAKMIYILRNPKDQAVSWFHFAQKISSLDQYREQYPNDWKKFTEIYFSGKHALAVKEGDWYPEHILSWYKHKHQDNVKFVYFEDMKKDLPAEVRKMAEFLNVELSEEQVNKIAEECGFDAMKQEAESGTSDLHQVRKSFNMMRKGQVGGWKDYFTVSQSEAIDEEFKQKLANTDIRFTYEL